MKSRQCYHPDCAFEYQNYCVAEHRGKGCRDIVPSSEARADSAERVRSNVLMGSGADQQQREESRNSPDGEA